VSRVAGDLGTYSSEPVAAGQRRGLAEIWARLAPYRPRLTERRFWYIQALVVGIAGLHLIVEILGISSSGRSDVQTLSFVPAALFFIPVVYAALSFGSVGAIPTAVWCTLLAVPNLLVFHTGLGRAGELFQIGMVDVIAVIAGQRVDRELRARQLAEAASAASRRSEVKYRALFDSSPCAILLLDRRGFVQEANPVAAALFQTQPGALRGVAIASLIGSGAAEALSNPGLECDGRPGGHLAIRRADGLEMFLEPAITPLANGPGGPVTQVVLRDVTQDRQRQAGLRAYAAHVIHAQEEERKRIAQELHDETVQQLVLLCRRLDYVQTAGGPLPAPAVEALRETRRSAAEAVESLRDFARDLRPPTLDDLGLVASIRRLIADAVEREKLQGELKVVGAEHRLPPDVELATFRIAQQALHNVVRHARATRVTGTIAFAEGRVRLEIVDNGVGFKLPDDVDLAATGNLGLLGMRERAETLGGRLRIRSDIGWGTSIAASIPAAGGASATVS
jgi:PAS domain S-box-containing protein